MTSMKRSLARCRAAPSPADRTASSTASGASSSERHSAPSTSIFTISRLPASPLRAIWLASVSKTRSSTVSALAANALVVRDELPAGARQARRLEAIVLVHRRPNARRDAAAPLVVAADPVRVAGLGLATSGWRTSRSRRRWRSRSARTCSCSRLTGVSDASSVSRIRALILRPRESGRRGTPAGCRPLRRLGRRRAPASGQAQDDSPLRPIVLTIITRPLEPRRGGSSRCASSHNRRALC